MNNISMTDYETASAEVRAEYDDQIAKHGRITNMKRTLLHNVPAFKAYMEWYTLQGELASFLSERAIAVFSHAISSENDCLICSVFFRKMLIDAGDDPDNLILSDEEQLLVHFGQAIVKNPHVIAQQLSDALAARYNEEQRVLLIAFAGIMVATNLFNTVARVELDEVLYSYQKKAS
ncbi:MAG: hypothetical protein LBJ43_05485 [Propionibacteriaceae bacterium]|jgi:alkylhydroperoxidase family enzyme|nr:hypothetical protein [Propionibacteriaceae bacterium]